MVLHRRIPLDSLKQITPVFALTGEGIDAVRTRTGCDIIINGGTYNMSNGALDSGLKIDGVVHKAHEFFGVGFNGVLPGWSYRGEWFETWIGAFECYKAKGALGGTQFTDKRGRTGIGFSDNELVLAVTSDGSADACTTTQMFDRYFSDCPYAINLDGGGSSQWIDETSRYIPARKVRWYICIWLKEENRMLTNLPLNGTFNVTAAFGEVNTKLWTDYHKGIDLTGSDNVYATCDGTVRVSQYDANGWGQYITIGASDGSIHLFAHLVKGSAKVKVGEKVTRNTVIGTMGATGNVTGKHLHYQINNAAGVPQDPTNWMGIPNIRGTYKAADYAIDKEPVVPDYLAKALAKGIWSGKTEDLTQVPNLNDLLGMFEKMGVL